MLSRPWKLYLRALVWPRCSLHTFRTMLARRYNESIVYLSVHYQACKNSAGNSCFDNDLSGDLIVEAIVKLLLSIVNYSARYAGNCSLTQWGRSAAYIRPKLGRTTLGLLQKEMTFVHA
jgi:hypothetical protein